MSITDKKQELTKLYREHSKTYGEDRIKVAEKIDELEKEIREGVENERSKDSTGEH